MEKLRTLIEKMFQLCHEYDELTEIAREITEGHNDEDIKTVLASRSSVHAEFLELRHKALKMTRWRKPEAYRTVLYCQPLYMLV